MIARLAQAVVTRRGSLGVAEHGLFTGRLDSNGFKLLLVETSRGADRPVFRGEFLNLDGQTSVFVTIEMLRLTKMTHTAQLVGGLGVVLAVTAGGGAGTILWWIIVGYFVFCQLLAASLFRICFWPRADRGILLLTEICHGAALRWSNDCFAGPTGTWIPRSTEEYD